MSSRKEIPIFKLMLLLFLVASKGFGDDHNKWSDRYIRWTKNDIDRFYTLQLCASRGDEQQCGNFTWTFPPIDRDSPCKSKFNCTIMKTSTDGKEHYRISRVYHIKGRESILLLVLQPFTQVVTFVTKVKFHSLH